MMRKITFGGALVAMSIVFWCLVATFAITDFDCNDYEDLLDGCATIEALRLVFILGSIVPYLLLLALAFFVRHYMRKTQ